MADDEMFDSVTRSAGDRAGVFEYDGDTGYFYLYETRNDQDKKVIAAIHVLTGNSDFTGNDIAIRWSMNQTTVGLFIRGQLWAAFDGGTEAKYGGNYRAGTQSEIPPKIVGVFNPQ